MKYESALDLHAALVDTAQQVTDHKQQNVKLVDYELTHDVESGT